MPTNLKLDDRLIEATVALGNFKSKQEAVNTALAEFVHRRQRRRILDLAGKITFDPKWDYKKMRRGRSCWLPGRTCSSAPSQSGTA
jgi:Arc/MetJ family transcription regulator